MIVVLTFLIIVLNNCKQKNYPISIPFFDDCEHEMSHYWTVQSGHIHDWSNDIIVDKKLYTVKREQSGYSTICIGDKISLEDTVLSLKLKLTERTSIDFAGIVSFKTGLTSLIRLSLYQGENKIETIPFVNENLVYRSITGVPISHNYWLLVKVAFSNGTMYAKTWQQNTTEPPFQRIVPIKDTIENLCLGLWTGEEGKVSVSFDDIRIQQMSRQMTQNLRTPRVKTTRLYYPKLFKNWGITQFDDLWLIENEAFALGFDPHSGRLRTVFDKRVQKELLSLITWEDLFTFSLTNPDICSTECYSSDIFQNIAFVPLREPTKQTLEIHFNQGLDVDVEAICSITVERDSNTIESRIYLNNLTDKAISEVTFPRLFLKEKLDQPDDDEIIFPIMGGVLFKDPYRTKPVAFALYPGDASYQMMAYNDQDGGIYLATYDPEGHVKRFNVVTRGSGVELSISHRRPEVKGNDFDDKYPIVITSCSSPWYRAADLYKEWAVQQQWCEKKLVERQDLPSWLKNGPAFLWTHSHLKNLGVTNFINNPETLITNIKKYRDFTDSEHIIYGCSGWEKQGAWVGFDYLPPRPSEQWWRTFCSLAEQENIHIALFTSGFKWTIKRHECPDGPHWAEGPEVDNTDIWNIKQHLSITNCDGTPYYNDDYLDTCHYTGAYSILCRGTSESRSIIEDVVVELTNIGVSLVNFDQVIGGGEMIPCYNKEHDHPPGFGQWMWEDYRSLQHNIQHRNRKFHQHVVLMQENEGELTIPYQGSTWARNYHILNHPVNHAWGIPVYPYLYHEYITCIGAAVVFGLGSWANYHIEPETKAYALARNLAFGQLQGDFAQDIMLNDDSEPETIPSQAFFNFCRPLANHSHFLILGTMKEPFPMKCGVTSLKLYLDEEWGIKPSKTSIVELPAVLQGRFESQQGETGIILVNATTAVQQTDILIPDNIKINQITEFRNGKIINHYENISTLSLDFEPLEPVFLQCSFSP